MRSCCGFSLRLKPSHSFSANTPWGSPVTNWKLIKQPWINKGKGQLPETPSPCHSSLVQSPVKLKKTKTCVHTSLLWFLCTLQAPVIAGPEFTPKQERDNLVLQVWLKSHSTPHAHENSGLDLTEQLTWLQSCHMRPNPNRNHLWYFNNIKSKLNSALYLTRIQHQFPWPTSSLLLSTLQGWESWKNELHSVKPHGQCCQLKCYPCSPCWGWAMKQNSLFSKSDARLQLFSLQLWLREGLASSDNIWMWSMVLAVSYRIWKGLRHDSVFLLHLEFAVMCRRRNSWERPRMVPDAPFVHTSLWVQYSKVCVFSQHLAGCKLTSASGRVGKLVHCYLFWPYL